MRNLNHCIVQAIVKIRLASYQQVVNNNGMEPIIVQLFWIAILSVTHAWFDWIVATCNAWDAKGRSFSFSIPFYYCGFFLACYIVYHSLSFIILSLSRNTILSTRPGHHLQKSSRNYFLTITIKKSILSKKIYPSRSAAAS